MYNYETVYLASSEITEQQFSDLNKKIEGIITAHEGQLVRLDDWGKRKLAYKVEKNTKGRYVCLYYTGNNHLVAELERNFKIHEQVYRYITVRNPDKFVPPPPKQMIAEF